MPYLTNPEEIAKLLANRDSQALWNVIEEYSGADLSQAISAYISLTRDAATAAPDDFERLGRHVGALRMAGRSLNAVESAEPFVENWARIEAVGTKLIGSSNEYAYALSEAGRPEEAHALMARVLNIGVEENGSLIRSRFLRFISPARFSVPFGREQYVVLPLVSDC